MRRDSTATGVRANAPVTKALEDVRKSFDRFCLVAGLEALGTMMEADVEAACGARHARPQARRAHRWGRTQGRLGFHGGKVAVERPDGTVLAPGDTIAVVAGPVRGILTGERVALNFLCHLSGIATATAAVVEAVRGTKARVVCTRKTMPGMRNLQKYAVRVGGGFNHRFGLDDAVLIKDNHIAAAGSIKVAVERARAAIGHLVKIELEVDTLVQLEEALAVGVDAIVLDNMNVDQLRHAVAMVKGRAVLEASGGIRPENAAAIAATGIDLLSMGWLTHSVQILDIGLDYR